MSPSEQLRQKVGARDAANRLLGRLTVGAVLGAVAGVGVLGYVSAQTNPGTASPATATNATTAGNSTAANSNSSDSSSSSTSSSSTSDGGLSAGSASSPMSGSPVAVTGGS